MAFQNTPVNAALNMDRATPIGNSPDANEGRGRLHTKVANNPDEPIYTIITNTMPGTPVLEYFDVSNLASDAEYFVLEYTIPAGKKFLLDQIKASGDNYGEYTVLIDSAIKAKKYTHFSNGFNTEFQFGNVVNPYLPSGTLLQLKVLNYRPESGNFNATLIGALYNE